MEMMFKLPPGKPPFIGVVFEDPIMAEVNKDLLELKNSKFSIMVLDANSKDVSFRLCSETPLKVRVYNKVKIDPAAYKAWRVYSHMKLNFGHVILTEGKPEVVRIDGKLFVLPIEGFITG